MIVAGQLHGGVAQGIGQALMEEVSYDDSGQPITGSFMDYAMPRAEDVPLMEVGDHPSPAKSNPLGTKGCGEAGCAGSLVCIVNAVLDALVRIRHQADRHAADAGADLARDQENAKASEGGVQMQPAIIDELRAAFDATTVLTGDDIDARYHTDIAGIPVAPPIAVMRPRTTEDVSQFLAMCHRARVPVTTQGGMTGLVGATMPMAGEIVLSMERMNAIEEVDTGGGVVIAQAGVPLQRVQERVAEHGFMYPLDLGARGTCTIGGNISTNAGGNRVIRYGMTRDLVLGLEAVLADGTVLKGVRKYIKNNTGTDLKQLFIGTEGTLGVVTRAALRIFPAPAEQQVALCALPSFDTVRALLGLARKRLGGELTAFEVMCNVLLPPRDRTGERRRRAAAGWFSLLHPDGILRERWRAAPHRR